MITPSVAQIEPSAHPSRLPPKPPSFQKHDQKHAPIKRVRGCNNATAASIVKYHHLYHHQPNAVLFLIGAQDKYRHVSATHKYFVPLHSYS